MTRHIAVVVAAAAVLSLGGAQAFAQETHSGPGRMEVTVTPGGGTYFVEGKNTKETSFGNYGLGVGVTVNVNRYLGFEGEFGGAVPITQDLNLTSGIVNRKSPKTLNYSGNVVLSAPTRSSVVPYAAVGIGGLSLLKEQELGINQVESFLTGNVGGGVKWYRGRWGARGDYRFTVLKSRDDAPAVFGRETRYGHRLFGAVLLNVGDFR
jgi:hypothetical protein